MRCCLVECPSPITRAGQDYEPIGHGQSETFLSEANHFADVRWTRHCEVAPLVEHTVWPERIFRLYSPSLSGTLFPEKINFYIELSRSVLDSLTLQISHQVQYKLGGVLMCVRPDIAFLDFGVLCGSKPLYVTL